METPATKSEATFAAIVDTALTMAAAEGIGKLSLGEVAKRMNISKSGVFSRVGSLQSLQEAVLDEFDRRFVEAIFQPAMQQPQGLPRLRALMKGWIARAVLTIPRGACLYISGAFEYDDLEEPLRERVQRGVLTFRAALRRTVIQSVEVGHLRPDTDPEQLVFEIYSLLIGLMHDTRFLRDATATRRVQAAFDRVVATYRSLNYHD